MHYSCSESHTEEAIIDGTNPNQTSNICYLGCTNHGFNLGVYVAWMDTAIEAPVLVFGLNHQSHVCDICYVEATI